MAADQRTGQLLVYARAIAAADCLPFGRSAGGPRGNRLPPPRRPRSSRRRPRFRRPCNSSSNRPSNWKRRCQVAPRSDECFAGSRTGRRRLLSSPFRRRPGDGGSRLCRQSRDGPGRRHQRSVLGAIDPDPRSHAHGYRRRADDPPDRLPHRQAGRHSPRGGRHRKRQQPGRETGRRDGRLRAAARRNVEHGDPEARRGCRCGLPASAAAAANQAQGSQPRRG